MHTRVSKSKCAYFTHADGQNIQGEAGRNPLESGSPKGQRRTRVAKRPDYTVYKAELHSDGT